MIILFYKLKKVQRTTLFTKCKYYLLCGLEYFDF